MDRQQIKQRFGIIGESHLLDRVIDISAQVAPTDMSVLITGESGSGKEIMPQIIHQLSARKHNAYIAVNCGAIPEGTIDSELFGHEKGSFTGAHDSRKGYFEEANGGTIFLDEVAELPLNTQVRLLRVLETGEFLKVGSSRALKTDVRIIAATNVNIPEAIQKGRFREDLFYRLNTVPIPIPALRERKEDIHLLFRKFAADFAEKYRMPTVRLQPDAISLLENYKWPGNIRQLKNITEQISIIENEREIFADTLLKYLPDVSRSNLPMTIPKETTSNDMSDREILYKVLFDLKRDVTELKGMVLELMRNKGDKLALPAAISQEPGVETYHHYSNDTLTNNEPRIQLPQEIAKSNPHPIHEHEIVEESLSLEDSEIELIKRALQKHKGKRKNASRELGISERTLYRKIKEHNIK